MLQPGNEANRDSRVQNTQHLTQIISAAVGLLWLKDEVRLTLHSDVGVGDVELDNILFRLLPVTTEHAGEIAGLQWAETFIPLADIQIEQQSHKNPKKCFY